MYLTPKFQIYALNNLLMPLFGDFSARYQLLFIVVTRISGKAVFEFDFTGVQM